MKPEELAPRVTAIVEEAGAIAAQGFCLGQRTTSQVWYKNGTSPVTASDLATNDFLHEKLTALLPEAAWLSEETADNRIRLANQLVWVIDPIDGTRAFMSGHPDWCVSVALMADGEPVLGNVFAPSHAIHYTAIRKGGAHANGQSIAVSDRAALEGSIIAGPVSMVERLERATGKLIPLKKIPSLALRLARVATGEVEIGLVSSRSCDWDIAAADLILREAGGVLTGLSGEAIRYNLPHPIHGELAATSKLLHASLIAALRGGS